MKTATRTRSPRLVHAGLSMLLIAAIAISGCGGRDASAPKPSVAPTVATKLASAPTPATKATGVPSPVAKLTSAPPAATKPTSVPTAARTAAPTPSSPSDGTIPISSGGFVGVPTGALPKGTKVDVVATQMPVLPDEVKPVGAAFAIRAAAQPATPVALRLPIPTGAADPENLAIIRVETDGAITFLMTAVEGKELVAYTPGFSTFAIGEMLTEWKMTLVGQDRLFPGERVMFRVQFPHRKVVQGGKWSASGSVTLVSESTTAAIIQAGSAPGTGYLQYECLDLEHGTRWYGSRGIQIGDSSSDAARAFRVRLMTLTPNAYVDEDVRFTASVYGEFEGPLTWSWDYGDGETGKEVTAAGVRNLELPLHRYSAGRDRKYPGLYLPKITVRDANAREAKDEGAVHVKERMLEVTLEGPQILAWKEGGVTQFYKALAAGGKSPYKYAWSLPEGKPASLPASAVREYIVEEFFTLPEPGSYRLEVSAEDVDNNKAAAALPIRVQGGEPLSTRLLDLPATAKPKTNITMLTQIRGGVLVVSGKKTGYTLQVDWGDGGKPQLLENVGANKTPSQGTSAGASHTYAEPKTYTVRVWAYDATGNVASDERKITITDASPTAAPTASQTKSTPAAKIATPAKVAEKGRWTRAGAPLINATDPKAPTEYYGGGKTPGYFGEERFMGKFHIYRLSETLIAMDNRDVDHGTEFWNVTIESRFDAPPPTLTPGQVVPLSVKFSGSASAKEGWTPPGARFAYGTDKESRGIIQPADPLYFSPAGPKGPDSKTWTLTVPRGTPGKTFQVWAFWWNCEVCNVVWTYRYEAD